MTAEQVLAAWIGWPEADTPLPESDGHGLDSAAGFGGTLAIFRGTGVAPLGRCPRDHGDQRLNHLALDVRWSYQRSRQ